MSAEPEIYGPPSETEFDKMPPERRAQLDKALTIADGIKLYMSAGAMGVGAQWAPYARALAQKGGLSPDGALQLARYRMWKQGMPVPSDKSPELTDEQKSERAKAFVKASPQQRAAMMAEDKVAIARSHQSYFDNLVMKQPDKKTVDEDTDPETGLSYSKVYPSPDGTMPPKQEPPAELNQPDLQLQEPGEEVDPKTGLSYGKVYPGPGGSMPPPDQTPDIDPKTGLDYNTKYY